MFLLAVIVMAVPSLAATENIKTECPKNVPVVIEMVKTAFFSEYQFSGKGQAEIVAVKSPVSGVLSEIKVSEGSLVDAGQDLAVLNAGKSEEIKKLEAEAAKAKKILTGRQNWKVKNEKAIQAAAQDYQKALDLLNEKKAQADQIVKAPVAGIVHLIMTVGSEVAADSLLLEISNPRQMLFQLSLAPADNGLLSIGDRFIGTSEGLSGEIAAEVIIVNETQAALRVNNDENQVKEGITFTFKKPQAEHADAIVIPTSAVQQDSLGDFVYVVEKKKAKKLYVTLGKSRAGKTMVLQGLVINTPFIVSGFECLADGKKIRIVNQEELAKEKAAVQIKKETDALAKEKAEVQAKEKAEALARKKAEALAKKEAEAAAQAQKKAEAIAKKEAKAQAKLKQKETTPEDKKIVVPVVKTETTAAVKKAKCPRKVAVLIETIKPAVFLEYQFSGKGQAEIVAVKSPVSGVLSEIKVSEGSLVDAGQDLAVLNAGKSEEIKKLEAEAAKAKKILTGRQNWKVKNEKAIQAAAQDYQKALDLLNEKKAQADQIVKAPVAGIVHLIMTVGSEVAADSLLLEISNPRQMLFQISLAPADKGLLSIGDKLIGTTEGLTGEVAAEVIVVSETQASFRVNNSENQIKAGVIFTFTKPQAIHADAIVIPTSAIQHDSLGDFVYVVEKNKAKKLYVTIKVGWAGKAMVLQGLAADTPFIVSGFECLVNGKKIRIVNQEELIKEKAEAMVKAEKIVQPDKSRVRVGLIFGQFSVKDKNMRDFYPNSTRNIPGVELSIHTLYNVDVWASYKSYTDEGTTGYFKLPIKFKLVPLSIGLRYRPLKWRLFEPFIGAGLNFYSYSETISGDSLLSDTKDKATGFHFQGGSYFHVKRFLLGEIFLKYNMVKKTLAKLLPDGSDKFDLGGFEMGVGIVGKF